MSVHVILDLKLKPELVEQQPDLLANVLASFKALVPDTRAFPGCETLSVIEDLDDPDSIIVLEQWASREDYEKYFKWRTERGEIQGFSDLCTQPVVPRYFKFAPI